MDNKELIEIIEKFNNDDDELKQLYKTMLTKVCEQLEQHSNFKNRLISVINELHPTTKDIKCSDHAVIRYFERILGFDIDEIKNKIITDDLKYKHKVLNKKKYNVNDMTVIIENNTVLTLYNDNK